MTKILQFVIDNITYSNIQSAKLLRAGKQRSTVWKFTMTHYGTWSSYAGSSSIILAVGLLIVTGVLLFFARRLRHPLVVKRPGKVLRIALPMLLVLFVFAFLVAAGIYGRADVQQHIRFTGPMNPILPVTMTSAVIAFFAIVYLTQQSGPRIAVVSAIVGMIAAPMIFEFPFDLIVMWRTYPPAPGVPFTLLYFVPLFLIEFTCFAMLASSPLMRISRYTLFLLAGMFLIFAIWALFGFAYPATPYLLRLT